MEQKIISYKKDWKAIEDIARDIIEDEMDIIESVSDHYKVFYDGRPQLYLTDDESAGFLFTAAESFNSVSRYSLYVILLSLLVSYLFIN